MPARMAFFVTQGNRYVLKFYPIGEDERNKFEVEAEELEHASGDARTAVKELCDLYLNAPAGRPDPAEVIAAVRRMARCGNVLKNLIFERKAGQMYGKKIAAENPRVTFVISPRVAVHVPYGLLFGAPERGAFLEELLEEKELRANFWGPLYGTSVVYEVDDRKPPDLTAIPAGGPAVFEGQRTKIFGIFHKGAIRFANGDPPKWPLASFSVPDFRSQWTQNASDYNILYFFCHADGEQLVVGQKTSSLDNVFVPYTLRMALQETRVACPGGLIVLNGCRTAVLSGRGGWLKATRMHGFSGFIGTESPVPTRFAWPFGNELLKTLLCCEATPLDALRGLWQKHWPLSLLYSLYCIDDVAVRPPATETDYLRRIQNLNYSSLPLGSGEHSTLPFGARRRCK